uniref:Protein kinase domain-containing protein n=1 Tax=Fusarium oxysporum (strain Fo5176) TaxID=660025 RepID=A0A0D2XU56_FUSOF
MTKKPWLPLDTGPKLPPYKGNLMHRNVKFLKVLDVDSAHGTVVKARIGRQLYAIKFNECRAFGRLKEQRAEFIAVKVYGWVALTAKQIERKLVAAGAKGRGLNGFPPGTLYGIVKDWVDMAPYHDSKQRETHDQMVAVKHFPRMLKDIHKLHFLGIVIRDLKPDQYIDGVLVDLSLASTVPHPYGPSAAGRESPWQPRWTYESLAAWDLYSFQCHVIDFWKHNSKVFFRRRRRNGIPKTCNLVAYPVAKCRQRRFEKSGVSDVYRAVWRSSKSAAA